MLRLILITVVTLFNTQCSDNPKPEPIPPAPFNQVEVTSDLRVLDEIPEHIKEFENLTVFSADSSAPYSARLVPVQTFGKSGDYYLTKVEGLTVDEKNRVIVADRGTNYALTIHVFNEDGTYRNPLGKPGRGPGEYNSPFFLQANAGNVYLYDFLGKRINAYNIDDYSISKTSLQEYWDIRNEKEIQGYMLGGMKVLNDGKILVKFFEPSHKKSSSRSKSKYLLMNLDGNMMDFSPFTFYEHLSIITENSSSFPNIFPIGRTLSAISNEGEILTSSTQEFLIKKYNSNGIYQSAIYYPIEGSSLDFETFLKSGRKFGPTIPKIDEVKKAYKEIGEEVPRTNPVVDNLMVDDENRIWVAVPTGAKSDIYEWWILAETGELLTKLVLPLEQLILAIKNGYVYFKVTDEETGEEYVVKYLLELTKN